MGEPSYIKPDFSDDFQDIESPRRDACLNERQAKSFWSIHKRKICTIMASAAVAIALVISLCICFIPHNGSPSVQSADLKTEALMGTMQGSSAHFPSQEQLKAALVEWVGKQADSIAVGQVKPITSSNRRSYPWQVAFLIHALEPTESEGKLLRETLELGDMPKLLQELGVIQVSHLSVVDPVTATSNLLCLTSTGKHNDCCTTGVLLCSDDPFDCESQVIGWLPVQWQWCCDVKGKGCPGPAAGNNPSSEATFDCTSDPTAWSEMNRTWCCARGQCPDQTDMKATAVQVVKQLPLRLARIIIPDVMTQRQTVTVVFNRAVIALGSNFGPATSQGVEGVKVDGRDPLLWQCNGGAFTATPPVGGLARWVTTSILRFDPSEDWPTDLDCSVKVNPELRSFDGTLLESSGFLAQFTTLQLVMSIALVTSDQTLKLTDGNWVPQLQNDPAPECPPDAVVTLTFNTAVDVGVLQNHLKIVDKKKNGRPVTVMADDDNTKGNQVKVTLPALEVGEHYSLILPAGVKVSANSGPTRADISVNVMGLHPFTFPWNHPYTKVAHSTLRLLVRHGVPASADLQQLQAAITIQPPIGDWILNRVSSTILAIHGDFQPGTTYKFIVESGTDIVDGYGLSLQGSSVVKDSEALTPFLAGPNSFTLWNAGSPDIKLLGRGRTPAKDGQDNSYQTCEGKVMKMRPISLLEIEDALNAVNYDCSTSSLFASKNAIAVELTSEDDLTEFVIPGDDAFEKSGVYLRGMLNGFQAPWQTSCFGSPYMSCSLGVDAIFGISTATIGKQLTVWVTSLDTAEAISEASVSLYYNPPGQTVVAAKTTPITDQAGMASFSLTQSGDYTVVVERDGHLALLNSYIFIPPEVVHYAGDLLTDRGLYRAGEEVCVKGYVQLYDLSGSALRIADFPPNYTLEISWGETSSSFDVHIDPTFGSFDVKIAIPADVKYGVKPVTLRTLPDGPSITSTSFVIADPRIPTGILEVNTPNAVYRPQDDSIQINIATKTYLGTPARNSAVQLDWTLGEQTGTEIVDLPEGSLPHAFQLPLSTVTEAAESQQTLIVKVQWFTAARDLLTKEVSVLVAKSTWSGVLTVPTQQVVPGHTYNAVLNMTIRQSTAVASEPHVECRLATENATMTDEDLFQKGTEVNAAIQFTWSQVSTSQTIISATIPFAMPSMGRYRLIAQFTDDTGLAQYAAVAAGKTEDEWRRAPLTSASDFTTMEFLDSSYAIDSQVRLRWMSPFESAQALLLWNINSEDAPLSQKLAVTAGENIFTFTLDSTCDNGCHVVALVVTPPQTPITVPVPVSQLLDTALPSQVTLGPLRIPVPKKDTSLAVEISAPTQMAPGETVEISVQVPISGATEIAVWVVDKALLDLQPSPLPDALSIQQSGLMVGGPPVVQSSYDDLASKTMLEKAYNLTKERLEMDPWTFVNHWGLGVGQGLDQDTATFLECQYTELTYFPVIWGARSSDPCRSAYTSWRGKGNMAAPEFGMATDELLVGGNSPASAGSVAGSGSQVTIPSDLLRSDFKATALFQGSLLPDANGHLSISFTAPDNVGTWAIRVVAVAVEGDGKTRKYGSAEAEVVAKRPLSLLASMPRITRVGDEFLAGCTVTSSTSGEVVVGLRFADENNSPLLLQNPSQQTVVVQADSPQEVVFQLSCTALGLTTVQIVAQLGSQSDAFQQELPSLGLQAPVQLATSFAITAASSPGSATRDEGIQFPDAVPQSGTLAIIAGVGCFPSVQALSKAVAQQVDTSRRLYSWVWATDLLSLAMLPVIMQDYAAAQPIVNELRQNSSAALGELSQYSSPIGLLDTPVAKVQYPWRSFSLNVYAIFVITRVPQDVIQQSGLDKSQIDNWNAALQETLDLVWASGSPDKWGILAQVYFAYGDEKCPSRISKQHPLSDLVTNAKVLSNTHKAMLLISVAQSTGRHQYQDFISTTAQEFYNNVRTTGKTAYITATAGSPNADSMQANALGLWALVVSQQYSRDSLLEKLANYVSQSDVTKQQGWYSFGSTTAVYRMLALAVYDGQAGSSHPDLTLTVEETHTSEVLLQHRFQDGAESPVYYDARWEDLTATVPEAAPQLSFGAAGTGEASVSLGLEFIPLTTFSDPVYFGIYVEKVIIVFLQNGSTVKYDPETSLQPGQKVKVVIQLTTVDELSSSVVVTDPLPGGLEAVDPSVGLPHGPALYEPFQPTLWFPDAPERWSFPTMEVRKDMVTFVAPYLLAGSHTCTYEAVAVTSGSFPFPPAKAYMSAQPEVMGLSNMNVIKVAPRSPGSR